MTRSVENGSKAPKSATHGGVAAIGITALILSIGLVRFTHPFGADIVSSALFVMSFTAAAILLSDLLWQKVHLRPSSGLEFRSADPSWERTFTKLLGLLAGMGFVVCLYWIFPEYHASFYDRYFTILRTILPWWLLLSIPYFYFVDRHMTEPRDGYWFLGRVVTFQWADLNGSVIGQHLLGWLVKAFFLPLMVSYLCNDLNRFLEIDFSSLGSFRALFDFGFDGLYLLDVCLASIGYSAAFRLTDMHLRSVEPTLLGWAGALACYEPFWSLIGKQYLSYESDYKWGAWLNDKPVIYVLWGSIILALVATYVWSTVMFGARFSNLTHRGIITGGPYRWTKHPAYIAKNLSWWMISIPFMGNGGPEEILRHCLLLLGLNTIYLLRAKTEEWHLSRDADYVRYAMWIDQHGLFRFLRHLPVLNRLAFRQTDLA